MHTYRLLRECEWSKFGNKDLCRLQTRLRPQEIDVFIRCRLKHLSNELIFKEEPDFEPIGHPEQTRWNFDFVRRSKQKDDINNLFMKSELRVENSQLTLKSEKKLQNNKLVGKSEQKGEQNSKLIRESKQAEQNNKLILKSEQKEHKNELILESEHQEQNAKLIEESNQIEQKNKHILKSELSKKLIGNSEQKVQNNKLIFKSKQKERNNSLLGELKEKIQNKERLGKSEQKEQNKLFVKSDQKEHNNELLNRSEHKEKKYTHILNSILCHESQTTTNPHKQDSIYCLAVYLTKTLSMAYSFVWLNEYFVGENNLIYDSKKAEIEQQISFFRYYQLRLAVELSGMVSLQLLENISERGVEESCASLRSVMSQLVANYMNSKFNSDHKNSICAILGNVRVSDMKETCLYRCEDVIKGNNTKVESSENATFQTKAVLFSAVHRNYFKLHQENNNRMKEASCGLEVCRKCDIVIFVYILNMDVAYRSSDCYSALYIKFNVAADVTDNVSPSAERRRTGVYSNAELNGACRLKTGGIIDVCIVDVIITGCRNTFISSVKDNRFLEMLLSHGDVVCFQITRILFCSVCNGHQVTVFCYMQNVITLIRNIKLGNENKHCKIRCHFTRHGNTNKFFNNSEWNMWKRKQTNKQHCHRVETKQNGYGNNALNRILYKEMSLQRNAIHKVSLVITYHDLFNRPENYYGNSTKRYYLESNACFNLSKMFSKCGKIRNKHFLENKTTFQMPFCKPKKYLTNIKTAKDVTTFIGTLNHTTPTSAQKDRTKATLLIGIGSRILEDHKKPNILIRMLRYTTNLFCQRTRSRQVINYYVENKKVVIKSGLIKARQAMISSNGTGLNKNTSRSQTSQNTEQKSRSQTTITVANLDDDDAASDVSSDEEDEITAKSTRIKANIECMDNFLIIWHSGFLIMFLFLLGVGIVLRVYFSTIIERSVKSSANYVLYSHFVKIENVPDKLEFGNLTEVLGESLIILSSLYIACVLCYMTFLIHRITFTIPLVVIVTGAVVLTEVNIINIYMSPVSAANEEAKKELTERANKEYVVDSNKPFSVTYDLISMWGQCCGIVDQYDFQNVMLRYFLPTKSEHKTLQVPPTCCKPSYFEKGVEDVVDCASTAEGIFEQGCYQTIYIWLRWYCNLYSMVVILQLLDLCIHIILYKKHLSLLTIEESHIQQLQHQATID